MSIFSRSPKPDRYANGRFLRSGGRNGEQFQNPSGGNRLCSSIATTLPSFAEAGTAKQHTLGLDPHDQVKKVVGFPLKKYNIT